MPVHVYASLIQNEVFHLWVFNSRLLESTYNTKCHMLHIYRQASSKANPVLLHCNTNSDTASTPENVLPEDLGVVIMLKQSAKYGERFRRT